MMSRTQHTEVSNKSVRDFTVGADSRLLITFVMVVLVSKAIIKSFTGLLVVNLSCKTCSRHCQLPTMNIRGVMIHFNNDTMRITTRGW